MPDNVRRRRPMAWSSLLRKGHVHTTSKTTERRARRASVAEEADEYLDAREAGRLRRHDGDPPDAEES